MITSELKNKIAKSLDTRAGDFRCPICGNEKFFVADGLTKKSLQIANKSQMIRGNIMPCAVIICEKCGFVSEHSIGILGLMNELEDKIND